MTPDPLHDDRESNRKALPSRLHIPRLATRGLGISLMMLLSTFADSGSTLDDLRTPIGGWPWRDAQSTWHASREAAPVVETVLSLHLQAPDDLHDEDDD